MWGFRSVGILKARFSSLPRLPSRIITESDLNWTYAWIGSCMLLHDLLIDDAESAPSAEKIQQIVEQERLGNEEHAQINREEPDAERRERGFGDSR
jgi:hypothetical protein